MPVIECGCGHCKLTLAEDRPRMSLYCACKDCRQALKWAAKRGGKTPVDLPKPMYMRSDISAVEGQDSMRAFQLRDPARSTRVFCAKCYSILGVDHPAYADNVFMFFPDHCETDVDLSIKPSALIHMESYPGAAPPDIPDDIPVYQNWDDPKDREAYLEIPDIAAAFRAPEIPALGQTFKGLIDALGEIEVLNLEIGADPD
ncbi:MAG: hypothetical protein VXX79_11945 [Pseudomonadota bacterium]|nr:hypothetical protein [Pseudomonadota bacterium]